jgi:hypothetical protein
MLVVPWIAGQIDTPKLCGEIVDHLSNEMFVLFLFKFTGLWADLCYLFFLLHWSTDG